MPRGDGQRNTGIQQGCEAWAAAVQVEFQNVQMRYREGLPLVLRGLSVKVAPGSRCGVVGRTGAGKSSLINCLFRRAATPLSLLHAACPARNSCMLALAANYSCGVQVAQRGMAGDALCMELMSCHVRACAGCRSCAGAPS